MKIARMRKLLLALAPVASIGASAQVPDLLDTFEMGGRSLGMGGALYSNAADPTASYWNPANLSLMGESQVAFSLRNLPDSNTTLTGRFDNPDASTDVGFGSNSVTFAGATFPIRGGTLGVSYARGGYLHELRVGEELDADNSRIDVIDLLEVATDFFTVAYGIPRGSNMNLGFGVVVARQSVLSDVFRRINTGAEIIIEDPDAVSETGLGFGGIVGVQFTPPGRQNISVGASFRSPMKVSGLGTLDAITDEIPARLQGGVVWRNDGVGTRGQDFLLGGIDLAYHLPANRGKPAGLRRDGQFAGGVGFEYNWAFGGGYVPIRAGFRAHTDGGAGFSDRTAVTFGVGYRPSGEDYWIDLNFATGSGQSNPDLALTMGSYIGK